MGRPQWAQKYCEYLWLLEVNTTRYNIDTNSAVLLYQYINSRPLFCRKKLRHGIAEALVVVLCNSCKSSYS
jgi:hypothetical protein